MYSGYFDGVDNRQIGSLSPGPFAILSTYFGAQEDKVPEPPVEVIEEIHRRCSELGMTHEYTAGTHLWQGFLARPGHQLSWFADQGLVICEITED